MKHIATIGLGLLTLASATANAQETFYTGFGNVAQGNGVLAPGALGSFASGSLSAGDATIVVSGGDAVARLNNATFLTLGFNLLNAATSITVSFMAASSTSTSAGNALVSIDVGPVQSQPILATNVVNPGGTLISQTFAGSFLAGYHSLKIDNSAIGFRVDDVSVTAVPEPGTYAMLLAGLAAVGFVAKRRKV